MFQYTVHPLRANRYQISVTISNIESSCLSFYLPVWIAGSYMRRDFVQHLSCLKAVSNEKNISVKQIGLSQWQMDLPKNTTQCQITYEYYARDYSVRGCYLDDQRGFFNPASACIGFQSLEHHPHQLELQLTGHCLSWQTSQPNLCTYTDYQSMLDQPIMIGKALKYADFSIQEIPHQIIISGLDADIPAQLISDIRKICKAEVAIFGHLPAQTKQYQFLLFLSENHYGGLEHQQSTLLMAPRKLLDFSDQKKPVQYEQLLGLFSHEYFHLWNIKSMRPDVYVNGYNLKEEQPSELLWFFEGFTAYFDNLMLLRSQTIDFQTYLNLISNDITRYWQRIGRKYQTLAESSFEAWTKLYNNGEDAINRSTNYYGHGSLAALMMDLFIIEHSPYSLTDVITQLWQEQQIRPSGITEAIFLEKVCTLLKPNDQEKFIAHFQQLIHSYQDIDFKSSFEKLGIKYQLSACNASHYYLKDHHDLASSDIGFKYQEKNNKIIISTLNPESNAAQAGLSPQDEIISIDQQPASLERLWHLGFKQSDQQKVHLEIIREGIKHSYSFYLNRQIPTVCQLTLIDQHHPLRKRWLSIHEEI